jgi:hypothetical protein
MRRLQQTLVVILGFAGCVAPSGVYSAENPVSIEIVDEIQGTTLQVSSSELSSHLFPGDMVSILVWGGATTEAVVKSIDTVETTTPVDESEGGQQVLVVRIEDSNREWHVTPAEIAQITIHDSGQPSEPEDSVGNTNGSEASGSTACFGTGDYWSKQDTTWGSAWGMDNGILSTLSSITGSTTTTLCLPTLSTEQSRKGDDTAFYRMQQRYLMATNRDRLAVDFASGGGEYASALAHLHGCPANSHRRYASLVRRDIAQIFPKTANDPEQILKRIETRVLQDSELATECIRIS